MQQRGAAMKRNFSKKLAAKNMPPENALCAIVSASVN
jgi:hypothetical protein